MGGLNAFKNLSGVLKKITRQMGILITLFAFGMFRQGRLDFVSIFAGRLTAIVAVVLQTLMQFSILGAKLEVFGLQLDIG